MRRRRAVAAALALVLLCGAAPLAGCTTTKKTTDTIETIEYPAGSTLPDGSVAEQDTTVTITRETQVTEERSAGCGGVVTWTAKVTWKIVTIPFRILGFVLDILI